MLNEPTTKVSLDELAINTIRFLSLDAVENANSGHPGLPMGAAAMAYVLWTRFLKHNPHDPQWFDRDRFVLSAGHGSMLLYSLLYLTGYDVSLDDIKHFRQWGSITPGHPEKGLTPGVEMTTGPLGQGFANGVGMAIAEAHLAARYNRPGFEMIDHYTYAIVSDGDLMEGVASEAASLAGHLRLGKLIYLYDDNHVSLAAATDLTFSEDVAKRFEAYGWHVQTVEDGNDLTRSMRALRAARASAARPSLIIVPHTPRLRRAARAGYLRGPRLAAGRRRDQGGQGESGLADRAGVSTFPTKRLQHFREAVNTGQEAQERVEPAPCGLHQPIRRPGQASSVRSCALNSCPAGTRIFRRSLPTPRASPRAWPRARC